MTDAMTHLKSLFLLIFLSLSTIASATQCRILILCAYNPESNNLANTIDSFEKELKNYGIETSITVESMAIDNFADAPQWHKKMSSILANCRQQNKKPDILILLGQEALATYLSTDISDIPDIPVFCGRCSRNYIEIPKNDDSSDWVLDSHDIIDVNSLYNIVGGCFFEYDIDKNIQLVRDIFPDIHKITFLSDNSYGGLNLLAHVRDCSVRYSDFQFNWLDGRNLTILSAADAIAKIPKGNALFIGTWRYDKDNRYYINSSIMMLRQNNVDLPVFTISSAGLKDWAIGGYTPIYDEIGPNLAKMLVEYLATGKSHLYFVPSHYVFNYNALVEQGISESDLPQGAEVLNRPESVFRTYFPQIATAILIFAALVVALVIGGVNLRKVKRLTQKLQTKQEELIEAKNKAEANSLLKTSFLADMSHEIRTPLNAIVGFSQVIANQGETLTPDERAKIVEIINKNSNLLTGILNSILDISSIESGRAKYTIEDVDLVELAKDVLADAEAKNTNNAISFIFKTDMIAFVLRTDAQRIHQVLSHILSNAVKFTKEGTITLSLWRLEDGSAKVAIADTGRGIPPDKANQVFDRFVKLDEYSSGTGLGLSLCRLIVERFGGKIWVDTSYTKGAKIDFIVPPAEETDFLPVP